MKLSYFKDLKWISSPELNCFIGVESNLPSNDNADIVYAKIEGKQKLKKHFHIRPTDSGYESFFFFNGANIKVHLKEKTNHIKSSLPFHLTFFTKEEHGIENLSDKELVFEVLCAPKHQEGEEILTE
ncbi:MAG: hypothetical protein HWD85_06090 [Flavobacteriaceae bacterium]|nr:hypothetical protein [Flavobacteriaceae bacterium]